MTAAATRTDTGLRNNAIGLREVLFQSITDMAPAAAVAASIPTGVAFAGGALPLSVLIAMVACLLTAFSIGELARHIPSAGSLGTYAAQGLHPSLGFLVAWAYLGIGLLIPPLVLLQLGFTTAATINGEWSSYPADLWWPWTIAGAAVGPRGDQARGVGRRPPPISGGRGPLPAQRSSCWRACAACAPRPCSGR